MSIKTEVKQNLDKIADSSAFHLVAGVGELAAEKLRTAQAKLAGIDFQARLAEVPQRLANAQERAQARIADMPSKLAALKADSQAVQDSAKQWPERAQEAAKQWPGRAQEAARQWPERAQVAAKQWPERAQDLALQLTGMAVQTYAELAERGRAVVVRQRANGAREADLVAGEPAAPGPSAAAEVTPPATPAKKAPVETAAKKTAGKKTPDKKTAGKKTPARKTAAKKTTAHKAAAKKALTADEDR